MFFFSGLEISFEKPAAFGIVIALGCENMSVLFVCLAGLVFFWDKRDSGTLALWLCECPRMGRFSLFAPFNVHVALQLRETNFSPSSSRLSLGLLQRLFLRASSSLFLSFSFFPSRGRSGGGRRAEASQRAHSGHCVQASKQYLPQPSVGSRETKPVLIPPNEPTQQSLLLDLYLLKSGEEKSSSFSTFPGICRLIDCFARAVCIFWNAWNWKNIRP